MKGIYDVTDFGATGDGVADDSNAIQAAIEMAKIKEKNYGAVVWFPPGKYRIGSGIVIEEFVTLSGIGWGGGGNTNAGTWIKVDNTQIIPFSIKASGVVIRDIGIFHEQPVPKPEWRPDDYKFAISIEADDVKIQNICLLNPTHGILLHREDPSEGKESTTGRITLDGIWGQPLATGIQIDNAWDVIRINNVHFWPFWSGADKENGKYVADYMFGAAQGIISKRNDNPFLSNIFMLGYHNGIHFTVNNNGHTNKFHIANADIDGCHTALFIDGEAPKDGKHDSTSGQIVNFTAQGRAGEHEFKGEKREDCLEYEDAEEDKEVKFCSATGIHVDAEKVTVQCSNIRLQTFGSNCIRVAGNCTRLHFENLYCADWDRKGKGFPAIEARYDASIYIARASLDLFDHGLRGKELFGEEYGGKIHRDTPLHGQNQDQCH
ncbi:hypothetical protein JDS91_30045 [Bacillus cereus]|uniref:glycosyl hydrolase family 28-related protein n=1 Tax=Bacillus cereus TaxID=1396 RepID=UPI0018F2B69C|nr:hypothetical protein [Bacillus cereus]